MSERKADIIDAEMITAFHALGVTAIHAAEDLRKQGDAEKAERYRRIGLMLEAVAYRIRDPLLVAAWEHTAGGNNRLQWSNELNRREAAAAAVYLLMTCDGQKAAKACKTVAGATGENYETLRGRFKGLALADYQDSPAGKRTGLAITNLMGLFPQPPPWRVLYDRFIEAAASLRDDMETDARRIRENWLNPPGL